MPSKLAKTKLPPAEDHNYCAETNNRLARKLVTLQDTASWGVVVLFYGCMMQIYRLMAHRNKLMVPSGRHQFTADYARKNLSGDLGNYYFALWQKSIGLRYDPLEAKKISCADAAQYLHIYDDIQKDVDSKCN